MAEEPDHHCHRCKRGFNRGHDHIKLESEIFFSSTDDRRRDYYLLCRFCYDDLVHWLFNDDGAMGDYDNPEDWDIPEHQKTTYSAEE